MDALNNALAFAELNYAVLPLFSVVKLPDGTHVCACGDASCASPGKHPHSKLAPRGLKDASTDPAVIRAWYQAAPSLNFGVATANLVVLDVDGAAGRASLARLEKQHGALPQTWRASTGSGGRHIYFSPPPRVDIRNSAGKLAKGLDVRANGGYVVVPGSRHYTGHLYAWFQDWHPNEHDMAPCPAWLLRCLAEPKHNGPRPVEEYRALAASSLCEGERNAGLVRLAGHLLANCVDPGVVHEVMQGWNRGQCTPPLSAAEVERSVASIALAELRKRGIGHD
jgi:hypothetical protein